MNREQLLGELSRLSHILSDTENAQRQHSEIWSQNQFRPEPRKKQLGHSRIALAIIAPIVLMIFVTGGLNEPLTILVLGTPFIILGVVASIRVPGSRRIGRALVLSSIVFISPLILLSIPGLDIGIFAGLILVISFGFAAYYLGGLWDLRIQKMNAVIDARDETAYDQHMAFVYQKLAGVEQSITKIQG